MIFGGIDTTGNTLGFLLYHLAANPDKQEILRKECLSVGNKEGDKNLKVKDLNELRYLKACIQETFRLTPTISMLVRMLQEDVILQGTVGPLITPILGPQKIGVIGNLPYRRSF